MAAAAVHGLLEADRGSRDLLVVRLLFCTVIPAEQIVVAAR